MKSRKRLFPWIALVIAVTTQLGCLGVQSFEIQIVDFDSAGVEGIWLWERDDQTSQYTRQVELRLDRIVPAGDHERLEYTMIDDRLAEPIGLLAPVTRDPVDPNVITIQLIAPRYAGSDRFRASTYNSFGESALSQESLPLSGQLGAS